MTSGNHYDPAAPGLLSFAAAREAFLAGDDSPSDYLERCLETISGREATVRAFTEIDADAARAAADAADRRYHAGNPLSVLDGMPVAIKDIFDTQGLPTEHGSLAYAGRRPKWDGAIAFALRRGGAVILGKTVTTELAFAAPGATRNPWDSAHTPGGSSSGSAAAVGAAMVPVAIGSQGRASTLRPASYCGAWALKPSRGTIDMRGALTTPVSTNHVGILAGTIADMWITAYWLSRAAGGEAGHRSLTGGPALPPARRPRRLARLDTAGWDAVPGPAKAAFETAIEALRARDVEIAGRADDPALEAFEHDLVRLRERLVTILLYEMRWPLVMLAEKVPERMSDAARERVAFAAAITPEDYERALEWADGLRARHAALAERYDALVTLSASGVAPEGMAVGDMTFGEPSSLLRVPAINAPLLASEGLPLGIQLMGTLHADHDLTSIAHWMIHAVQRGED